MEQMQTHSLTTQQDGKTDGDGVVDEDDDFENDPSQGTDSDDGYGDNPNGSNPDAFPNDLTNGEMVMETDTEITPTNFL